MEDGIENRGESMPKTRKSHPPSLKAKVAVEAIKAHKTAQVAKNRSICKIRKFHEFRTRAWMESTVTATSK
jgi:hypothetical protein